MFVVLTLMSTVAALVVAAETAFEMLNRFEWDFEHLYEEQARLNAKRFTKNATIRRQANLLLGKEKSKSSPFWLILMV